MKQRDLLLLLISTFILVVFWIGFSIYHKSVTSTISETLSTQIAPINPNFDSKTIEKIKKRKVIVPIYEFSKNQEEEESSTQSSEISPESPLNNATPSATPTLIQGNQATGGGILF